MYKKQSCSYFCVCIWHVLFITVPLEHFMSLHKLTERSHLPHQSLPPTSSSVKVKGKQFKIFYSFPISLFLEQFSCMATFWFWPSVDQWFFSCVLPCLRVRPEQSQHSQVEQMKLDWCIEVLITLTRTSCLISSQKWTRTKWKQGFPGGPSTVKLPLSPSMSEPVWTRLFIEVQRTGSGSVETWRVRLSLDRRQQQYFLLSLLNERSPEDSRRPCTHTEHCSKRSGVESVSCLHMWCQNTDTCAFI